MRFPLVKKMRPPLGIGGLGRRVSLPVSFSHRRVGSSILASLSEVSIPFKNKRLNHVFNNLECLPVPDSSS
jgi:hypothetical protein